MDSHTSRSHDFLFHNYLPVNLNPRDKIFLSFISACTTLHLHIEIKMIIIRDITFWVLFVILLLNNICVIGRKKNIVNVSVQKKKEHCECVTTCVVRFWNQKRKFVISLGFVSSILPCLITLEYLVTYCNVWYIYSTLNINILLDLDHSLLFSFVHYILCSIVKTPSFVNSTWYQELVLHIRIFGSVSNISFVNISDKSFYT